MNIEELGDRYLQHLALTKEVSPHTLRAYRCDFRALRSFADGQGADADILCEQFLVDFFNHLRAQGCCSTTIRRRAASVRGLVKWLVHEGHCTEDPWPTGTIAAGRRRQLPRLVPAEDLQALISSLLRESRLSGRGSVSILKRPNQATTLLAVLLMVTTGMRVHEVVSVSLADVDLPGRCLRVHGKGRRERQVYIVGDWLASLLRAYLETRHDAGVGHQYLLFNMAGQPLTTSAVRCRLRTAGVRAGLGRIPTPHMLRHTAATQLMEADVDIRYIQRLLGHASLSTTEIYTHVTDPALRGAVVRADVMTRLFSG